MSDYGTLETIDGQHVLRFERRFSQPVERVWRAVTDPGEMKMWFPSNVEGDRRVGAELVFSYDVVDENDRIHPEETPVFVGEVLRFEPPRLFEFTWGGEVLRLELLGDGDGTRLLFSQILSHRSTAGRNGSGWHGCLTALEALLGDAGEEVDGFDLYDDYVARIGIQLGKANTDGSMTWELATQVGPTRAEQVIAAIGEWAGDDVEAPIRCEVAPAEHGAVYRVTHERIDADPELAAVWHARLTQLDLYMAAGVFHPVSPAPWIERYKELLGV